MINAAEAQKIVYDSVEPLGAITVDIERSLHRVIGEDVVSLENVPAFDNAQMDGYAVRADDVRLPPSTLKIVGEIPAGANATRELGTGDAASIMTGAKIPSGCDAVVQQEWTKGVDLQLVTILRSVSAGHNIRKAGADVCAGSIVLQKGHFLRPQEIGILASLGRKYVVVHRPAGVGILPTGNEVIGIEKPLAPGKIRNSNASALASLVREAGAEAVTLDVAKDEKADLTEKIVAGLRHDMLITTGGVSVGKYDLVAEVLREIGVDIKFWKVNIKPGMPLLFGMYNARPVFGLPGNPVSTVVTFLQFVKPALYKMMGRQQHPEFPLVARLSGEIKKTDGKRHFVRGILEDREGILSVHSTGPQTSNVLSSLVAANCLIVIPEEKEIVRSGENVEVQLL